MSRSRVVWRRLPPPPPRTASTAATAATATATATASLHAADLGRNRSWDRRHGWARVVRERHRTTRARAELEATGSVWAHVRHAPVRLASAVATTAASAWAPNPYLVLAVHREQRLLESHLVRTLEHSARGELAHLVRGQDVGATRADDLADASILLDLRRNPPARGGRAHHVPAATRVGDSAHPTASFTAMERAVVAHLAHGICRGDRSRR
mmetsp:Transcript_18833/g.34020  ORF Transcript_18833/g.34020 Transcript_18833/m.34020 type:complete len:212 (-) Transcript_18833:1453-2088(-)